jgi:hypothetical protein
MNRRKAVTVLSVASLASGATTKSDIRSKFVGVWKLVSCESKDKATGEVRYPYGAKPVGRITYDAAGRMSAQLMDSGRRKIGGSPTRGSVAAIRDASPEDLRNILAGYTGYFGTFHVDEASRTVVHHVEGHVIPGWVGADMHRSYEFAGADKQILTAAFDQVTNRLVWQRESTGV